MLLIIDCCNQAVGDSLLHLPLLNRFFFLASKLTTNLKVTAGQVSLVDKEPSEQTLSVFSIVPVDVYNSSLKLNDIALVKVNSLENENDHY